MQFPSEGDHAHAYTLSELHVLHQIATQDRARVTSLAMACGLTRGAISKIVHQLLERNDIIPYQQSDNHKNIYYRCTDQGEAVEAWHQSVHRDAYARVTQFFARYTPAQRATIAQFLSDVVEHGKLLKGL